MLVSEPGSFSQCHWYCVTWRAWARPLHICSEPRTQGSCVRHHGQALPEIHNALHVDF